MADTLRTIISQEEVAARVRALAQEIQSAYDGQELTIVALLEDSFMFLADMIRHMDTPMTCSFLKASKHQVSGHSEIVYTTEFDAKDRNLLLVGGILDTGVTLAYLIRHFSINGAKSVRSAVLIDKPDFRNTECVPDFVGFSRTEKLIVGYGLGHQNHYRQLPYVAELEAD
ncbi:MAG: hypothetical protein K1Y36_30390 [Blastocatellia bacterium]|nr:hypothetical protein [Blastocatellia bacterium]